MQLPADEHDLFTVRGATAQLLCCCADTPQADHILAAMGIVDREDLEELVARFYR